MALIKCRECGHTVSTDAMACPGCGAPPRRPSQGSLGNFGCLVTIAGFAVMGYLSWRHGMFDHVFEKIESAVPKLSETVNAVQTTQTAESVFKARTAALLEDKWIRDWATIAKGEVQNLEGGEIQGVVHLSQRDSDYVAEYTYRYHDGHWKRLKITQKADYMVDMKVDMIMAGDTNPDR